eukprot:TRINITY_DN22202_c0_g1_i1.p1 TRINITY_DN22202_c0_g1~~TRINITY_DN22202_c0_g1_i1.p1  ORF type:complete len:516 (-),score=51.55 TRINITY_DN22202_c0_g1_i1:48-1367(-)
MRSLRLDKIEWYGFDMDYTMIEYKNAVEELTYDVAISRLLSEGYPAKIEKLKYDPEFPLRGIILDNQSGNFLKVDRFAHIVSCVHGRRKLSKQEIYKHYPSGRIDNSKIGKRFHCFNTLFSMPEMCLYADLVELLEKDLLDEISCFSYYNLYTDVRAAIDYIHLRQVLKPIIIKDPAKYIVKRKEAAVLLHRLRSSGKKVFLLTNSDYFYSNKCMSYLLDDEMPDLYKTWRDYFDVIIVSAKKPTFFSGNRALRKVDLKSEKLRLETVASFERGQVYNGGSLTLFNALTGATGSRVLYIGDHIFSDIITSKKTEGWRNLLVIREVVHEVEVWRSNQAAYNKLQTLEFVRAEIFRGLDSESTEPPDLSEMRATIRTIVADLDTKYNKYFGSLFSSGTKQSFFAMQVQRYADLYASNYTNLLQYPLFYLFSNFPHGVPHQS